VSNQRFNVTLPEDVSEILRSKKSKSGFLAEAVREKAINDKKREITNKAKVLKKYYEHDEDLNSLKSLDSLDFVE